MYFVARFRFLKSGGSPYKQKKNKPQFSYYTFEMLAYIKQLLDEVEHDTMNYQSRGLCYLPKPKAEVDNTDTRVW